MSMLEKFRSHQIQLDYHIKVHQLSFPTPFSVPIKVSWKRRNPHTGKKCSEFILPPSTSSTITCNEILTMVNTIYQHSSEILPKIAEIKLFIKNSSWEEIGKVTLNLAAYIKTPLPETKFFLGAYDAYFIILSISTKISSLSQKSVKEPSLQNLEKQLNDSQTKLKSLEREYRSVVTEKDQLKNDLEGLKTELDKIQKIGIGESGFVVQEENQYLKKVFADLCQELEEANKKGAALEKCYKNLTAENTETGKIGKISEGLNEIIKKYFDAD